jgi:hypothetical protein
MDVDKLTGHRRKRDSEEGEEEVEGAGVRDTPMAGGFPGGDGSGPSAIPPASTA